MKLVQTEFGVISSDVIEEIRPQKNGRALIMYNRGESRCQSVRDYDDLVESLGPLVPDSTGIIGLIPIYGEGGVDDYARVPVVAWRETYYGIAPVFADNATDYSLLYPSGQVEHDGSLYDSYVSFFKATTKKKLYPNEQSQAS